MSVFKFSIGLQVVDRPLIVTAWSGSLALKIVYEIFHRVGVDFEKRSRKPLVVEPLIADGGYLLTGLYVRERGGEYKQTEHTYAAIEPGAEVRCVVYVLSQDLLEKLMRAITQSDMIALPGTTLSMTVVDVEEVQLPALSEDLLPDERSWIKMIIALKFKSPTAFMLHGTDVLYPSPVRALYSIARIYGELSGADLKDLRGEIPKVVDIYGEPRVRRYRVDIGEGRRVPAFMGSVSYVISGRPNVVFKILQLLKAAEHLGIGISRALGFGRVEIVSIRSL